MNLLQIKPFQETLHQSMCGPASLKMVFDYYGVEKSEQELAKMCNVDEDLGTDDVALKKVAEELGFKVEIKDNSSLEDIQKWLDKKAPVIVDWFTRGRVDYGDSEVADGHYSVAVGLDENFIYLQDPEIGKLRKIGKEDFMKVWFDFKGKYIEPDELIFTLNYEMPRNDCFSGLFSQFWLRICYYSSDYPMGSLSHTTKFSPAKLRKNTKKAFRNSR